MFKKYRGTSFTEDGYTFKREKNGGVILNMFAAVVDKVWGLIIPYLVMTEIDLSDLTEEDDV